MSEFAPSRIDGRSDRRVIFELAQDASPDTLFDFDTLHDALSDGVQTEITRARICRAVRQGNKTLLREKSRYLAIVRNAGYRMIRADEHLPMAIGKKSRAEQQIKEGIEILKNVRVDELDETQRLLHTGQLMVMNGVYQLAKSTEKRQKETETVLDMIREQQNAIEAKLDRLERRDA